MQDEIPPSGRRIRAPIYWALVLALAIALGALFPAVFLLGFWEMAPLVLLATWLSFQVTR
jgi:hypothetical protein